MEGKRPAASGTSLSAKLEQPVTLKVRKLSDWLTAFNEYTETLKTPASYRRWAGVATLASALERRVWVRTNISPLYPNLYVLLVGPAGLGKGVALNVAHELLTQLPDYHGAPSSVSRASLVDALKAAERKIVLPQQNPPVVSYNSLSIIINEFGTFLPQYDNEFMATLTDMWDCKRYDEMKRTSELNIKMKDVQLNIFAGTTVSYLLNMLPDAAWDQGFMSRTLLVYSGEIVRRSLFEERDDEETIKQDLIHDLKVIAGLYGKMRVMPDAITAIDAWNDQGGPPAPTHPKMLTYNSRRTVQVLKLATIISISRSNSLVITIEDFTQAVEWLIELEANVVDIFKTNAAGGDGKVIEDTYYWITDVYVKKRSPLSEEAIISFIQNKAPAHAVMRIFDLMLKSGLLEKTVAGIRPKARININE